MWKMAKSDIGTEAWFSEHTKELSDNIVWRNKLAHKVPFYEKTIYPTKVDVLNFIHETNKVVDFIDTKIAGFKSEWFSDF